MLREKEGKKGEREGMRGEKNHTKFDFNEFRIYGNIRN